MSLSELTTAVQNTLLVYLICTSIALPLGTLLALLLFRTNVVGRQMASIALASQLAVPLYVFAGGWSAGFGSQGWFTALGLTYGFPFSAASLQGGWEALPVVALIHALAALPWVTLLIAAGLVWANRSEEDQAIIDGGWARVLLLSVLPRLRFWLLAAAIWCAIPILTEMVVSNLYQVPTIAEQVYLDASRGSISPLTYVAAVLWCCGPLLLAFLTLFRFLPKWQDVQARASLFPASVLELGGWKRPLSAFTWILVGALVGLPIISLIAKAGWQPYTGAGGRTHYGWTLQRFVRTVYESATLFQSEFFWSTLLAILGSTLALGVALAVFTCCNRTGRYVMSLLMLLALSLPGPLVGMLLINIMNRSSPAWLGELYDRSIVAPLLAQQFRLMPLAWIIVCVIASGVSRSTWDLAKLEGLSRLQLTRSVLVPQFGKIVAVAWLMLAVLSIGELSCSILVLPPGVTTISMRLFEMLHFGMRHQDSGICGVLLLGGWLTAWAAWNTLRER